MNILIINTGSSSIKFQLLSMPEETVRCSGMVERIGNDDALFKFRTINESEEQILSIPNHTAGLQKIADFLLDPDHGVIRSIEEIQAIGHRVVHGGNAFSDTCIIDDAVKLKIKQYSNMAPLHNPNNLTGIELTELLFPKARQVAVFDTAFHQSIPIKAHKYAVPNEFYTQHGLKAYGFHGTSHAFVAKQAMDFLGRTDLKIISIHLGNGCSITAVENGRSIDTSLGFGPSNGLIMGTRSGDIDHSLIFYLIDTLSYKSEDIKTILDKKSGMLGLTGYSDLRDIQNAAALGDKDSILALNMNAYRIKKYIGAYTAAMNGLDALIFTAGIGENSSQLRSLICTEMDYLGIELDSQKNEARSGEIRSIDSGKLKVRILVVPTNEELEIARQAYRLLNKTS